MKELPVDKSLDQGSIDINKGCWASLVDPDVYVYSDAHQYYTSITGVIGTPQALLNASITGRLFKADAVVYTNVTGSKVGAVVIARRNLGASSTWRLVLYADTGI